MMEYFIEIKYFIPDDDEYSPSRFRRLKVHIGAIVGDEEETFCGIGTWSMLTTKIYQKSDGPLCRRCMQLLEHMSEEFHTLYSKLIIEAM